MLTVIVLLLIPVAAFIYLRSPQYRAQYELALAEKGDPAGEYRTCLNYAIGNGVKQDIAEAARWALKAEAQGHHCREKLGDGKIYDELVEEMARQDKLAGRKPVKGR